MSAPTKLYRIVDWHKTYEKAQGRKCQDFKWVAMPNRHDTSGYGTLMEREDGVLLYGVWCLIVQVASKMPVRGVLAKRNGPLTAHQFCLQTKCEPRLFDLALQVLSSPDIGWVEQIAIKKTTTFDPKDYQFEASKLPLSTPETTTLEAQNWEPQDKTRQDRTGQDKKGAAAPRVDASASGPTTIPLITDSVCLRLEDVLSGGSEARSESDKQRLSRAVDGMLRTYRAATYCDWPQANAAANRFVELVQECIKSGAANPVGAAKHKWYEWAGLPIPEKSAKGVPCAN